MHPPGLQRLRRPRPPNPPSGPPGPAGDDAYPTHGHAAAGTRAIVSIPIPAERPPDSPPAASVAEN
ncbi:hypothetical protein ACFONC_09460 [Luteimonas soli]|uniref:Uncharacterized protein n=1 Tax=Luteimonas soli TaxID=1648966 RepID=A0ABV7XKY0_9GAMM